jgi:hypothetical protein
MLDARKPSLHQQNMRLAADYSQNEFVDETAL